LRRLVRDLERDLETAGGCWRFVMVSDAWNTMRKRTVDARKVDAL